MLITTLFTLKTIYESRKKLNNTSSSTNIKDIKFAINSLSLNVSFFLFNIPKSVYLILDFFIQFSQFDLYYLPLSMMAYSHFGTLFFITLIVNSTFRNEYFNLISDIKCKLFN